MTPAEQQVAELNAYKLFFDAMWDASEQDDVDAEQIDTKLQIELGLLKKELGRIRAWTTA